MKKHVALVHGENKPFKFYTDDYCCSQKSGMNTHVESVHEEKKPTLDFQEKMSNVLKSTNDNTAQKQGDSKAMEESGCLSNFLDVEQNLDDEITIKEEWDVFEQEQEIPMLHRFTR